MSRPTKVILTVYAVAIAGWFLHVILTRAALAIVDRGGSEMTLLLPLLVVDVLAPPILMAVLAVAVVRAVRDLLRQPEVRTPATIGPAVLGSVGLAFGPWLWLTTLF